MVNKIKIFQTTVAMFASFILLGFLSTASANLISNGDFETGDLTDWNTPGSGDVRVTPILGDLIGFG